MDIELVPCSVEHLEALIQGADAFRAAFGLQVVDGYLPFEGALQYSLNLLRSSQIWNPWLPYLFIFPNDKALVGLGGFKSVPDPSRVVEIGYSVAPAYQGRGFATSAARQLIEIAAASALVDKVCAHTLAEPSASTTVLEKSGMMRVAEIVDPEDGQLWQWEIKVAQSDIEAGS
ncbi:MAG: GNAT family N-acetyltransferase [Myxacorys californica WJT36-NPBG1]|jgi:RimJ/RimL family protein N-acetyltransferase|nr:GNAT family N-acetyltransferase [Myxacorys californica WJT36-NPBG1]